MDLHIRMPVLVGLVLALAGAAMGDTIIFRSGTSQLTAEGTITGVKDGQLVWKSKTSGNETRRALEDVLKLKVDGEVALNAAEEAYAAEDFKKAAAEYQRAIAASRKDWVKLRSAMRVIDAAGKSDNLAAAISGYAQLVKSDPALAAENKPKFPRSAPGTLDAAVREAERAANASGVTAEQKTILLTLTLQLANANGDNETASRIAELLGGTADGAPVAAGDVRNRADTRIQVALTALTNGDHKAALEQIAGASNLFVDPDQQVEALYIMAEAKHALAKDEAALKDAALDYMRAVARAKKAQVKSARIPDALLKTGVILEKTKANGEAEQLYQQITQEYEGTEAAAQAAAALERIEKAREQT